MMPVFWDGEVEMKEMSNYGRSGICVSERGGDEGGSDGIERYGDRK